MLSRSPLTITWFPVTHFPHLVRLSLSFFLDISIYISLIVLVVDIFDLPFLLLSHHLHVTLQYIQIKTVPYINIYSPTNYYFYYHYFPFLLIFRVSVVWLNSCWSFSISLSRYLYTRQLASLSLIIIIILIIIDYYYTPVRFLFLVGLGIFLLYFFWTQGDLHIDLHVRVRGQSNGPRLYLETLHIS